MLKTAPEQLFPKFLLPHETKHSPFTSSASPLRIWVRVIESRPLNECDKANAEVWPQG